MLRKIDIAPLGGTSVQDPSIRGGNTDWIIKKARIEATRHAADIAREARRSAEELLAQAQLSARECREAGLREGLANGVRAAMVPLVTLLQDLQSVQNDLRIRACTAAQSAMQDFLAKGPAMAALLDQALALQLPALGAPVHITVPSKADVSMLEECCRAHGLDARIEVSDQVGVFSANWEGHFWEVHVESLVGPLRTVEADPAILVSDDLARAKCRDALIAYAEQLGGEVASD